MIQNTKQYLNEVKVEMKKVVWPSRKDAMSGTVAVIIFVILISIFLGLSDLGLSNLLNRFIN